MTDKPRDAKYRGVKIVMQRSFEDFTGEKKEEFLGDVAQLSRSSKKKMRDIKYRRGCVVFEAELPIEATARLLELFQNRDSGSNSDDINEFINVSDKHRVLSIRGRSGRTVEVLTSRKSEPRGIVLTDASMGDSESSVKMPELVVSTYSCKSGAVEYFTGIRSDSLSIKKSKSVLSHGLIGRRDIATNRIALALRNIRCCNPVEVNRSLAQPAELFAEEFGAREWYPSWQEQLANEAYDAVSIAKGGQWHAAQTMAAAYARKHVSCEKPMMNADECAPMTEASRANKIVTSNLRSVILVPPTVCPICKRLHLSYRNMAKNTA